MTKTATITTYRAYFDGSLWEQYHWYPLTLAIAAASSDAEALVLSGEYIDLPVTIRDEAKQIVWQARFRA